MRPLVVLSLVIVAVAALLFALTTLGGEDPSSEPIALQDRGEPAPAAPDRDGDPDPRATLTAPQEGVADPRPDAGRAVAESAREEIGGASASYPNVLVGRITDPEGEPLENVLVTLNQGGTRGGLGELQRMLGQARGADRRNAQTDASGEFRFRSLEPGAWSLTAKHPDFARKEEPHVYIAHEGETYYEVSLEEGLVLHGYVRDHQGNPLEGAELSLTSQLLPAMAFNDAPQEGGLFTETDETGYYRFTNVTPGSMALTAHADGFGSQTKRNLRLQNKEGMHDEDFRLQPGKSISGRVYTPDRSPIADARVEVMGYQQPQTLSASTMTDPRGEFEIPGLVEGAYFLRVTAKGWGEETRQRVEAPSSDLEIEMTEQGTIMGSVVSAETGDPVTEYVLTLHQYVEQSGVFGRPVREEKFESEDGSFVLKGVTEGRWGVQARSSGYAPTFSEDVQVDQGLVTSDVVVRLGRGGTITGRVVDARTGKPVRGATVSTQDNNFTENALTRMFAHTMPRRTTEASVRTDEDGRFELDLLMQETYQILVKHPQYPDRVVRDVAVIPGDETDVGRVSLEQGATVRGTVYDSAGRPLSGATVQLTSTEPDQSFHSVEVRSDREGRYELRNVPAGAFRLVATRPYDDQHPFQPIVDIKNSQRLVNVRGGGEYTEDLHVGG